MQLNACFLHSKFVFYTIKIAQNYKSMFLNYTTTYRRVDL